mgnify:FL=1
MSESAAAQVPIGGLEPPPFWEPRCALFDELWAKQEEERLSKVAEQIPINVVLPSGNTFAGIAYETTPLDVAKSLSNSLAKKAVVALVNGELWDMTRPLEDNCSLEILDFNSEPGQHVFWHSSAHIFGQAMELMYHCNLCSGHPIEEGGFFYEGFMGERTVREADFPILEEAVKQFTRKSQPFQRLVLSKENILKMFADNPFKVEMLSAKVPEGSNATVYRCGNLIDPCRGPHLPFTGSMQAFKITKNSSSYFKSDKNRESLQRIYALSFPTSKELNQELKFREMAALRDHRRLGLEQDLFFFHPYSPGSCFFLPNGTKIYNKMMTLMRKEYRKRGYQEVMTPNLFDIKLWETSGHWQHYQKHMFSFQSDPQTTYALKPMNCPSHCLMFDHRSRSYKELPLRFADFGVLHRNEDSGALSGLTRVRRFQQDDAHIFCGLEHVEQEILSVLEFMQQIYGIFGFNFELALSTRPAEGKLGTEEQWDQAEADLRSALERFRGSDYRVKEGDGAFYGPKIDIYIEDSMRRKFQCATVQLDFQLPKNFGLNYSTADAAGERLATPVIIHRAIYGSFERFLAILTEHLGGKWPFWLSPRQCIVVPVSDKFTDYANEVKNTIFEAGFDADVDLRDAKLQRKIRDAQLAQFNYILVVGEIEEAHKTVNVRTRDNEVHGEKSLEDLLAQFKELEETLQ